MTTNALKLVHQHTYYYLELDEETNILKFSWTDQNGQMSYEDFQEACSNYVGFAFEYQVKHLLVDTRNFQFTLPESFPEWREKEHYPRFFKLGVLKMAYVMPAAYLEYAKNVPAVPGKFPVYNFIQEDRAIQWLLEE